MLCNFLRWKKHKMLITRLSRENSWKAAPESGGHVRLKLLLFVAAEGLLTSNYLIKLEVPLRIEVPLKIVWKQK